MKKKILQKGQPLEWVIEFLIINNRESGFFSNELKCNVNCLILWVNFGFQKSKNWKFEAEA